MKIFLNITASLTVFLLVLTIFLPVSAEKTTSDVKKDSQQQSGEENKVESKEESKEGNKEEKPGDQQGEQDGTGMITQEQLLGTSENGITLPEGFDIMDAPMQQKLMNPDFSKGLKYWSALNHKTPSDISGVVTECENSYLVSKAAENGDGLITLPFFCENIVPGQPVVVVYDWSGPKEFTITLNQADSSGMLAISSGFGSSLYKAKSEAEWNTNATAPIHPVKISDDGYNAIFFVITITMFNPSANIKLDNFRLGYANANGVIYDVNGNEIKGEARTATQAEAPIAVFEPPLTDDRNSTDDALERGGDNEELINTLFILATAALCVILALVPSAVVKAIKKRRVKETFPSENKSTDKTLE